MTTILRLLAILALLLLVAVSWGAAFAVSAAKAPPELVSSLQIELGGVLSEDQLAVVRGFDWVQVALWAGAGLFFLISAIRLMRATQGWFLWLLGVVCYVGRWVAGQGGPEAALGQVSDLDAGAYLKPGELLGDLTAPEVQVGRFSLLLLLGLIVLIVDLSDKARRRRLEG
jgi:hypothetical protein